MTLEIESRKLEDTLKIGEKIGLKLRGGEIIELVSDVGGGKTAFVIGLAKGASSQDEVASPSFTISRHYDSGDKSFTIQHFDFYRLNDPGLIKIELAESLGDEDVVTIIEWSNIVSDILPDDRLHISIEPTGDASRKFKLRAGENHTRLIEDLA